MADPITHAPGLDVGRIKDFVNGMKEAHDADTKALLEAVGVGLAVNAWSNYHGWIKGHK